MVEVFAFALHLSCVCYTKRTMPSFLLPVASALLGVLAFLPFSHMYLFSFFFLVPLFLFYARRHSLFASCIGTASFYLLFRFGASYFLPEIISISASLLIFCGLPLSIYAMRAFHRKVRSSDIPTSVLLAALPFLWTAWDTVTAWYSPLPTAIISAGNALGSSPFVGLAVFGGVAGLTFFVTAVNAAIAAAFLHLRTPQERGVASWIRLFVGITAFLVASIALSEAVLSQRRVAYEERTTRLAVTALSVTRYPTFSQHLLMQRALRQTPADLVVLPEVFFDALEYADYRSEAKMSAAVASLLPSDSAVGIGVFNFRPDGGSSRYETAVLAGSGGVQGMHHKSHPVFIGEYWPFGSWHPAFYDWLRSKNPRYGSYAMFNRQNAYAPGELNTVTAMLGGASTTLAVLVCSEVHYPRDISWYRAQGAQLLVNSTSNRWFGKGGSRFLFLTRNLRRIEAVETNLPIVVSGFEDVAGIFTPDGREQTVQYRQGSTGFALFSGTINL